MTQNPKAEPMGQRAHAFLGSLKDALAAAGRDDGKVAKVRQGKPAAAPPPVPAAASATSTSTALTPVATGLPAAPGDGAEAAAPAAIDAPLPSAAEAAREVRGTVTLRQQDPAAERPLEIEQPPTTRVVRAAHDEAKSVVKAPPSPERTQLVRGRQKLARTAFSQDPVVAWLVVVGGPGLGAFRPIFEGNNTIGRAASQRVPIDFGDDAISSEEQAYIRYDSHDRSFLFVPNLAKTNVVQINDKRPTSAVELSHMDVITMGRTQLVFVPFCGADFDWAELADVKD